MARDSSKPDIKIDLFRPRFNGILKSLVFWEFRVQICFQVNDTILGRCRKTMKVSLKELSFYQKQFRWDVHILCTVYSSKNDIKVYHVCFIFYLPKVYFRLFFFFLSAVLVDLVCWVMMDGHATILEYCIIYLKTILFSLTHVIKWNNHCFFLQMEQ